MDKDLKNKTLDELEQLIAGLGGKKYIAEYIFSFIHSKGINDITQISPASAALRKELIACGYYISQLRTIRTLTDPDGTVKYLFELADGSHIETVLLFDGGRRTLCVSTQVGCAMGCVFCATGKVKLRRNLTAAEIVDQVNTVQQGKCRISNVVYMGMGEPMRNYDAVMKSVRILNHPLGKNIGLRRLTISTCGDAEAIEKLAGEEIHPRLAISLNAPNDSLRSRLMPVNKRYPIAALLAAVRAYQRRTRQRVTFEYVLIKGLNDTAVHTRMLVKLLRGFKCNVNLIEYNPHSGCNFVASGRETIERFAGILEGAGIKTTVRLKMGRQIKAACGQLGADLT